MQKNERKLEKEILGVLVFLVALIVVYLIASSLFRSFNSFTYEGLYFSKERLGEIPLFHYTYNFESKTGAIYKYNLYLRNDPRTNDVPVEGGRIKFERPYTTFISINNTDLQQCETGTLAVGGLAKFLSDNQIPVKGANMDFWQAGANKQEWVTCENKPSNPVIEIFSGNVTEINIEHKCYRIKVADCRILEAIEKFQLQSILDAKS